MNLTKIKYLISKNLTFSQLKNRKLLKKEAIKLRGKILDLGCGNGEYSFLMAKHKNNKIFALESNERLCKEIVNKNIENIEVILADGHNLPFTDNTFDACFCNTVLEHVKDPEKVIREIKRVLKKEGTLVISIPFLQEIHADPHDFQRYTPYGLKHLMEENNFIIKRIHCDFGSLNVLEYLTLGSIIWRFRIGFKRNFPFGYIYILFLTVLFFILKISHLVFFPLQKRDKHFLTLVALIGIKSE
jgi:ubiquinone/menaquinone biosynthesis C-methylase UbiE